MGKMITRTKPQQVAKIRPAGAKIQLLFVDVLDEDGNPTGDTEPNVKVTAYGLADGVSQQNVGTVDDIMPLLTAAQRTSLRTAMRVLFDKVVEAGGGTLVEDDDPTQAI